MRNGSWKGTSMEIEICEADRPLVEGQNAFSSVELIGGPRCGDIVCWPIGQEVVDVACAGGVARYRRESEAKAVYVGGMV